MHTPKDDTADNEIYLTTAQLVEELAARLANTDNIFGSTNRLALRVLYEALRHEFVE